MAGSHRAVSFVCALMLWAGVAQPQETCGSWQPVAMPDAHGHGLASVSASSASDVWAVWQAAYHWNGIAWTQVAMPGLGHPDTVVRAVAAVRPGEAWAAGWTAFLGTPQTLIQRWDGSRWNVVPSPVSAGGSELDAIVAIASDDVWAVGSGAAEFPVHRGTLAIHWDGSSWTKVPSPNVALRSHELLDIAATAANDVWAVGSSRNMGELYRTLILHWDGASWSVTPSPNLPGENILYGVSARAPNDVWAVGGAWDGVTSRQVFLHWDGTSWTQVGVNGPVTCTGDVLAMGPNDVWAAGSTLGHWNGSQWTLPPNPVVPGSNGYVLRSLAKVGACDAWAVGGSFDPEFVEDALAMRLGSGASSSNLPPVAHAAASPTSGAGPLEVHFSSAGSHDPDGSIVSYRWNFGDSSPEQDDANPVHTFLQTGALTYEVTLVVRDNHGAVAQSSVTVRITPPLHVEAQDVSRVQSGGGSAGRNVISIVDRDGVPMAGATVTAQYLGPSSGIATGTTDAGGEVVLETSPANQAPVPWCFSVIDVAKTGCIYVPASNTVTEQCESGTLTTGSGTPRVLALRAGPSPMREACDVHLSLPSGAAVRLVVHDLLGRQVREIRAARLPAGEHAFRWDGRDAAGRSVSPGMYVLTAQVGDRRIGTRVVRMR